MTHMSFRPNWTGYHPKRLSECGIPVRRETFWVRDRDTNTDRVLTVAEWHDAMNR